MGQMRSRLGVIARRAMGTLTLVAVLAPVAQADIARAAREADRAAKRYEHYCAVTGCDQGAREPDVIDDAFSGAMAYWLLEGARRGLSAPAFLPHFDPTRDYSLKPGMFARLEGQERWMVATTTRSPTEAITFARAAAIAYPAAQLFLGEGNVYHVVVGTEVAPRAREIIARLVSERKLPPEARINDGSGFIARVWASDRILAFEAGQPHVYIKPR